MAKKPSAAVAKAILANKQKAPQPASLDAVREKAKRARSLELEIQELQQRVSEKAEELRTLYSSTLPSMMSEIGLNHIGIEPDGNLPGLDFEKHTYYSANIAASWDPEKKGKAFDTLKKYKADDLIKSEVKAKLPKGSLAVAKKAIAALKKLGIRSPELTLGVNHQTLTAWLRSRYEKGDKALPQSDLDAIGASIGEIVRIKEQKKD